MAQFFRRPRGIHCLAADSRLSQKSWYALTMFAVSRDGNFATDSPVRRQKRFQSALRKFQRFTGSLWARALCLGGVMREGRCCDRGKFLRTRLCGSRLSWPKLAKTWSGLVPTFHRWEEKMAVSFGSYNNPRLLDVAQEYKLSPSGDVVTPVDILPVEIVNAQTGVWERLDGRWCESRVWRFINVREGGVQSTLFCNFNHCSFVSSPNKLKICHTTKQLYIHNITLNHENNAFQKQYLQSI